MKLWEEWNISIAISEILRAWVRSFSKQFVKAVCEQAVHLWYNALHPSQIISDFKKYLMFRVDFCAMRI